MNLVTGATGILGSHVVLSLLKKNRPVTACKQKNSDLKKVEHFLSQHCGNDPHLFSRIKWVDLDLGDLFSVEDALDGIDTVYHCAGFVSFNRHHRRKLMEVNYEGTKLLVNACITKKIKAFCHVSSLATLHNLDYTEPLNEQVFWKKSGQESAYAVSKYRAECEVWRAMEEGLNAVIVNPGVVLASGFWGQSSSRLFDTAYRGNIFYTPGTTAYVAATDVAEIMIVLTDKGCFNQRFVLAEGNYSYKNILSQINAHFKKPVPFVKVGRLLLNLAWLADSVISFFSGRKPTLTQSIINSSLNVQLYSNKKIKEILNYPFTPISEVIAGICKAYLADKQVR